ncbi:hypothetical protein BIW11_05046 [Tropilaelaps mercedesae]|uniref:Uncharacterized protein n=1 Tax=Tropilaelaps mercedesae TaxID=418985 RepID=A0A1V9WY09_9ACAR|nr:hypothetical protein BIW11_05046 [Tropilaelaps mercedesae]
MMRLSAVPEISVTANHKATANDAGYSTGDSR